MTTPTIEQLREAAAHLARAATFQEWGVAQVEIACALKPLLGDIDVATATEYTPVLYALSHLAAVKKPRRATADGFLWLAEAARWRLLIEAMWQEQQARRVPVGHPDRDRTYEPCGVCGRLRMQCGCDRDEMLALVEQLTAPADAPTG